MTLFERAILPSYEHFAADYTKCRNKEKGRPIKGWCRLFKEGDDYVVKVNTYGGSGDPLFRVSPDNTITFVMPLEDLMGNAQTVVSSLWRVVPILVERKRKGVYAITSSHSFNRDWAWLRTKGQEYYAGVKFDLETGECLNPTVNMLDKVIPEVRKQWLRDVKRFKKGLKARAKVGALQGYITKLQEEQSKGHTWAVRYRYENEWSQPETMQHLLECMKNEEYPPELLMRIVGSTRVGWRQSDITNEMVLQNVDAVFDSHSIALRKAYGVFGEC